MFVVERCVWEICFAVFSRDVTIVWVSVCTLVCWLVRWSVRNAFVTSFGQLGGTYAVYSVAYKSEEFFCCVLYNCGCDCGCGCGCGLPVGEYDTKFQVRTNRVSGGIAT